MLLVVNQLEMNTHFCLRLHKGHVFWVLSQRPTHVQ